MIKHQWPTWLFSYNFDGKQWSIEVIAPTAEEAKRRLDIAAAWGSLESAMPITTNKIER